MLKRIVLVVMVMVLAGFTLNSSPVRAEAQKIGVMNIQKVLLESSSGRKAKEVFEKRTNELQRNIRL